MTEVPAETAPASLALCRALVARSMLPLVPVAQRWRARVRPELLVAWLLSLVAWVVVAMLLRRALLAVSPDWLAVMVASLPAALAVLVLPERYEAASVAMEPLPEAVALRPCWAALVVPVQRQEAAVQ